MSTSRLSKTYAVLRYFDTPLTKEEFIEKFCAALKKYVMSKHPEQSESLEAKKVAVQAWQNYLRTYDFFVKNKVDIGTLKDRSFTLDSLDKIYFVTNHLTPKHMAIHIHFRTHPEAFEQLSAQDKDKILNMLNLPMHVFMDPDDNKSLIANDNQLTLMIANTLHLEAMFIINLGVDVNQYSPYRGNTPLLLAISKGWIHQDPNSPESKSSNFYPQKEIIKALLEKKADVNAIHLANGMTPLHIACLRGDDPELINLLLANGANIHAKDYEGRTPLELMNLNYENTQKIILSLTSTPEDSLLETFAFGCKSRKFPENRSTVATLPLREERIANQTKIRAILTKTLSLTSDVSLGQNHFGKFATPSASSTTSDKSIQAQAANATLSHT